jgi:hypothetical protein
VALTPSDKQQKIYQENLKITKDMVTVSGWQKRVLGE